MNYHESVKFLDTTQKFGSKLGLDNIKNLLAKLDHPENKLTTIHIAGTNGKGSISQIINNILIDSNYTVGIFNSPYILSYKETIKINNTEISNEDFAFVTSTVREACEELVFEGKTHPTLFECVTAISLFYFHIKKVDFAIIETGLGGSYDATNVFNHPLLSVIASIDIDHANYLGNTLKEITFHKAGIIKSHTPVVLSANQFEAVNIINDICFIKNVKLYYCDPKKCKFKPGDDSSLETVFDISTPYFSLSNLRTKLLGEHQFNNIITALTAIHIINKHFTVERNAIYTGLYKTSISSRCEYISGDVPVLLDGAHNPQSLTALSNVLDKYFSSVKLNLLFGALEDKDIDSMLKTLSMHSPSITLTTPHSDRSPNSDDVIELALKYFDEVEYIADPVDAFKTIYANSASDELVVAAGSFYITSYIKDYLDMPSPLQVV